MGPVRSGFGGKRQPLWNDRLLKLSSRNRMYSQAEAATLVIRKVAGTEEKMTADGRYAASIVPVLKTNQAY